MGSNWSGIFLNEVHISFREARVRRLRPDAEVFTAGGRAMPDLEMKMHRR